MSAELTEVFQERKTVLKKSGDAEFVAITKDRSEYSEEIISVILSEGDIAGGVIFLQKNEKKHFGEMEKKFAAGAADLLGRMHRIVSVETGHASKGKENERKSWEKRDNIRRKFSEGITLRLSGHRNVSVNSCTSPL